MESNDADKVISSAGKQLPIIRLDIDGVRMDWIPLSEWGIWISRMPVSRSAYRAACSTKGPVGTQSATSVSWNEAMRFCKWLNAKGAADVPPGYVFRLPTVTEWMSCVTGRRITEPPWGAICPDFGDPDELARVRDKGTPFPLAVLSGRRVREPGLWQWTGDLYDPGANLRILRCACWYGRIDGQTRFLYHRTPHPDEGHPAIAFRVVAAPS